MLYAQADKALYQAKRKGKNQIVFTYREKDRIGLQDGKDN